ncbi:MAG: hypothetical protein ACD_33C00015G0002 [uncultured bacterium]|nr:MAG: hypothetical protein ACD_33C00015G0002 [uncultured bacterium]
MQSTLEATLSNDILVLLNQQVDNFPELNTIIDKLNITPSSLFLPQVISNVAVTIESNISLVLEAINFLDIVKLYSFTNYKNTETITDNIYKILISNRTVVSNVILGKNNIDDLILDDEKINEFLINNKTFVAIYIVSLLNLIFFKSKA